MASARTGGWSGAPERDGEADFPGRYLMLLLPLLAAASALDARAKDVDRTWARRRL